MLHGRRHLVSRAEVAALVAAHLRRGHRRSEERILTGSLDHASPARVPADVDHRVEGPLDPVRGGLVGRDRLVVAHRGGIPATRLGDRHREDRLVPVDDVQGEDHRDVQPRLQRGPLHLVDVVHADQVEHRADLAVAYLCEQRLPGSSVRAGRAGHLQLPELFRQRHAADQAVDLGRDQAEPLLRRRSVSVAGRGPGHGPGRRHRDQERARRQRSNHRHGPVCADEPQHRTSHDAASLVGVKVACPPIGVRKPLIRTGCLLNATTTAAAARRKGRRPPGPRPRRTGAAR